MCICMFIHYIHPELRIEDYRSGLGKGAGPLWREHRGSVREHEGARESTMGQCRGAAGGRMRWLSVSA